MKVSDKCSELLAFGVFYSILERKKRLHSFTENTEFHSFTENTES